MKAVSPPLWKSVFSLKPLLLGSLLLLLGLCGFVYNSTRPAPPAREWIQPIALRSAAAQTPQQPEQPIPQPEPARRPLTLKLHRHASIKTLPPASPPVVRLTSPAPAASYTAPAAITYKADVTPSLAAVRKIEFFYAPDGGGVSVGNNVKDIEVPESPLIKRGEALNSPYTYTDREVAAGIYAVYAVVTTLDGVRQISRPVVISVNDPATSVDAYKGWKRAYERGVVYALPAPSPTPSPTPGGCLTVKVKSPEDAVAEGEAATLSADVGGALPGADLKYTWKLTDGRIVKGQNTRTIDVATKGLGGTTVIATVEVSDAGSGCAALGEGKIHVVQPEGVPEVFDEEYELELRKPRLDNLSIELHRVPGSKGYVVYRQGDKGERRAAEDSRNYLIKTRGVSADSIVLDGAQISKHDIELWLVPPGASPPYHAAAPEPESAGVKSPAPKKRTHTYVKCPDVDEMVAFRARLGVTPDEINFCPYNPRDPLNTPLQVDLVPSYAGVAGVKRPSYTLRTWEGVIENEKGRTVWDLSPVKLQPGYHAAAVEVDGGCGCTGVAARRVRITNYCSPCLSAKWLCQDRQEDVDPWTLSFSAKVSDWAKEQSPTYKWTVSGGEIIEGQGTSSIKVDTSGLERGTNVFATVEVGGLYQYCVRSVSVEGTVGQRCPTVFDAYPDIKFDHNGTRVARRRQQQGGAEDVPAESTASRQRGSENDLPPQASGEKEYIKIAWPNPVQIDRPFSITVRYNRTKEKVELQDTTGNVVELLPLGDNARLLKDRWGADYEVWASLRLQSAGLGCPDWCRDEFKPLTGTEQKWTLSLTPKQAGPQTFTLELWAEGRHTGNGSRKDAEPVWSKDDLSLLVKDDPPTRNQLVYSSAFLCLVGVGFSIRGIKIKGLKIIIAGGDVVGGDKVGGDKIGGDKVGGDKVGGRKSDD